MKKIAYIILLFSIITSACSSSKKRVEYKTITEFDLGNLKKENPKLTCNVVFFNLSDEELLVEEMLLDFKIDDKDVGTIVEKSNQKIRPHSEFFIQIKYQYPTNNFLEKGYEPSSKYAVSLLGDLKLKDSKGKKLEIPVKFATTYEYKTNKEERIEKRLEKKESRQERRAQKRMEKQAD